MIHTHQKDPDDPTRPRDASAPLSRDEREVVARDVLGQVSGKWSFWALCVLAEANAPLRFTRVHEAIDGITQKVLTQTLRHLERDGFVMRHVYPQVPPRVEYELTALGRDLLRHVDPVVAWARGKAETFEAARNHFDTAKGCSP